MSGDALRFLPLCPASGLKDGSRQAFEIEGRSVLVIKIGSDFFAVRNRCTHLDYPLDRGRLIGFQIMCPKHGARFDIRTGRSLGGPANMPVETYKIRIVDDMIEIGIPPASPEGGGFPRMYTGGL